MADNPLERRSNVFAAAAAVNFQAVLAISLAIITILVVGAVMIFSPETDVDKITAIAFPIIMLLLAGIGKSMSRVTNGQLGLLLKLQGEGKKAEGEAEILKNVINDAREVNAKEFNARESS